MADYISRDAVLELVDPDARPFLAERIRNIPSADVAPVKRGKWIHERIESAESSIGFFLSATCECSLCRTFIQKESNYCPDCGAKMGGKR